MPPFELLDEIELLPEPSPQPSVLAEAVALGWALPLLIRGNRLHLGRADGATRCGLRGEPLYLPPPPLRLCRRCARLHRFQQPVPGAWHLATRLEVCERETLLGVLQAAQGNRNRAARAMGVSRATMYRLLEKHRLLDTSWRQPHTDAEPIGDVAHRLRAQGGCMGKGAHG